MRRHDAELGVGEGRDIGGARQPVDRRHLAEAAARPQFAENHLAPGGGANQDPDLAMHDEIHVARVVVEVEHQLALSVTAARAASPIELSLLRLQILEERDSGERHRRLLLERSVVA